MSRTLIVFIDESFLLGSEAKIISYYLNTIIVTHYIYLEENIEA